MHTGDIFEVRAHYRYLYISINLSLLTLVENLLYNRPISLFPFAQMESMCLDQDKSDEMSTPKYLKASTCSSGASFSRSCGG